MGYTLYQRYITISKDTVKLSEKIDLYIHSVISVGFGIYNKVVITYEGNCIKFWGFQFNIGNITPIISTI